MSIEKRRSASKASGTFTAQGGPTVPQQAIGADDTARFRARGGSPRERLFRKCSGCGISVVYVPTEDSVRRLPARAAAGLSFVT